MNTKPLFLLSILCAVYLHAESTPPLESTAQKASAFRELRISEKVSQSDSGLIKEANVLLSNLYKIEKPMGRLLKMIADKEDKEFFNRDWLFAATFKNKFKFRIQEEELRYRKSEMASIDTHRLTAALMMHMPYVSAALFNEYQLYRGYLAKNKDKFSPEEQKEVIELITDLDDQFEGILRTLSVSPYMLNSDDVWAYVTKGK